MAGDEWRGVRLAYEERESFAPIPVLRRWPDVVRECARGSFDGRIAARMRSLRRAFFELRAGIYVRVEENRVARFVPFCNPEFRGRVEPRFQTSGALPASAPPAAHVAAWAAYRRALDPRYDPLPDPARWWYNGRVVCNEFDPENPWGTTYLYHVLFLLVRAARRSGRGPIEFMFNKRDAPVARRDGRHPHSLLFGGGAPHADPGPTLPTFSFYGGDEWTDLLFPNTDDIETAFGGLRFPPHFAELRDARLRAQHDIPFAERRTVAFFRGSATGAGVTCADNTRLALAELGAARPDVLDAGVTSWNARDKVQEGGYVAVVRPDTLPFPLLPFVPQYAQTAFAYHIYADGHSAASRLGSMLASGSLVLRLASRPGVAGRLWIDEQLRRAELRFVTVEELGDEDAVGVEVARVADIPEVVRALRERGASAEAAARRAREAVHRILSAEALEEWCVEALRSMQ